MNGLTGKIKFDQHGLWTGFELDIIELKQDELVKVGTWTESGGLNNYGRYLLCTFQPKFYFISSHLHTAWLCNLRND